MAASRKKPETVQCGACFLGQNGELPNPEALLTHLHDSPECADAVVLCPKCSFAIRDKEDKKAAHQFSCKNQRFIPVPWKAEAKRTGAPGLVPAPDVSAVGADILLNPILPEDRFGVGMKNGGLYFGLAIANRAGEILPAVMWNGRFIFGAEQLTAAGFSFGQDFGLLIESWPRDKLHAHLSTPEQAPTTDDLFAQARGSLKSCWWCESEAIYDVAAAYCLLSYIYPFFAENPRLVVVGMPGSGKSTLTDWLAKHSLNAEVMADPSKASIFRTVHVKAGFVAVDNFDKVKDEVAADLGLMFDIGYQAGRLVPRVEGEGKNRRPRQYSVFGLMAVNSETDGWLKFSSRTRSIFIRASIKEGGLKLRRVQDIPKSETESFNHRARLWAMAHGGRIAQQEITDSELVNRQASIAEGLIKILLDAAPEKAAIGAAWLNQNFNENQMEDEFGSSTAYLEAVLEVASKCEGPIAHIMPREVAKVVLERQGTTAYREDGSQNQYHQRILPVEARKVSAFMGSLPFQKKTHPKGVVLFDFVKARLVREATNRGIDPAQYGLVVQGILTDPNLSQPTPTHPNLPSPTPTQNQEDRIGYVGVGGAKKGETGAILPDSKPNPRAAILTKLGVGPVSAADLSAGGTDKDSIAALASLTSEGLIEFLQNGNYRLMAKAEGVRIIPAFRPAPLPKQGAKEGAP